MLDTDFEDAFEEGDGVFGDELLEGDEEGGLEADGALDVSHSTRSISGDAS